MAIYKPPKLKNAKEFLTDKKVNRSSPEEYYAVTSQKFSLYDPDTAYPGSQRAKQEKEAEKRSLLPKVSLQEIRDMSENQDLEYLSQEEVANTEPKKTDIGALGRSLRDLPRNLASGVLNALEQGSGVLNALEQGSELLTFGMQSNDIKPRTRESWEKMNQTNTNPNKPKTYEEYLASIDKMNQDTRDFQGKVASVGSEVTSDTTLFEKMVKGAAQSLPSSLLIASVGGGLAGMAGAFVSNPIVLEIIRTTPLFASGTHSGLKTAEELGLTGAKKYSYAILSGLLEAGTERLSSLGLEGKLLGKKTSGGVGGTKEFLRAIFEESGSEMLNEVGQQLLTGQYTNYEDFELDFENIIVAGGSAALMGGFGAVGELANGLKYKTVGTEDNMVIIETEDGRREKVNPEIVMRHQLANGRTARKAQELLKADAEIQDLAKNFTATEEVSSTMPLEDTTTPQEQFNTETEPSMPIEEKPLTEPLNKQKQKAVQVKAENSQTRKINTENKLTEAQERELQEWEKNRQERLKELKEWKEKGGIVNEKLEVSDSFRESAERRKIIQGDSLELVEGGLTPKELAARKKFLNTNYSGKKVKTPLGNGKVIRTSFGKVQVELDNGKVVSFEKTEIEANDSINAEIAPSKKVIPPPEMVSAESEATIAMRKAKTKEEKQKAVEMWMQEQDDANTKKIEAEKAEKLKKERPIIETKKVEVEEDVKTKQVNTSYEVPADKLSNVQLVERIKTMAKDPQSGYGLFVKERNLKPDINAKEFGEIWNQVKANRHIETVANNFVPNYRYKVGDAEIMAQVTFNGTGYDVLFENGSSGGEPKAFFESRVGKNYFPIESENQQAKKVTTPSISDGKSIPPPETELQANEERLNNMIEKGLIDTKRKRDMAKNLNQKIVEQGGQDRIQEIEPKKAEVPKPKKAEPKAEIDKEILESVRKEQERTGRTIAGTERFPDEKVELPKVKTVTIGEHKGAATIVDIPIRGKQKGEVLFKPLAGHSFEVIEGYPVVIANNAGKWQILDKQTGLLLNGGYSSRKAALEDYLTVYKKYHEKAISGGLIEKTVEEFKAVKENQAKAEYDYARFLNDTDLISSDDDLMSNNMAIEAEIEPMDSVEPVTTDIPEIEMMEGYKTSATKKSLLKAPNIPQAYKDNVIGSDPMFYETSQRIARELEANQEIETKTYDVATKEVLANHKADPKLYQSKEGQAMIQALIKKNIALREQYKDNGFYQSQYEDLQKVWRETGTDLGQSLNMRKQLYGDTIEGKLIEAERIIEDSKTKEHKELEDRMNKIVDDIFEKTLELDENGKVKPDAEFDDVIADIKREFGLTNAWIQMLRRSLEEGTLTKVRMKEIIKEKMGIPTLTMAEVDKITEIMKRLDALDPKSETYTKDKEAILQDATMVYAQKDVTFWTKLSTYQTMAMLMNVKTTLRNEIGNLMGFTTAQVDDVFSFFFDEGIARITKQRGTVNPRSPFKLKYKDGVIKSFEAYGSFLADASENKYVKRRVFAPGSMMGKLEGAMGVMLSDARWKQPRVEFLLEQIAATEKYAKERGLEYDAETARLKENINFIADYDTFNFNSKPAQVLDGVVKSMNKFGNKDFGLGTLFAKFSKTPMNIIQYQLDHIGADLLREGVKLSKLSKKIGFENALKQNQGRISRALGKTATGMTYVTLGALLSNLGAFVEEEEDKDVKNILEAQGIKGGYFNFSALRRSIASGKPSSYKDGDTVLSVNWVLPVAPFLLLGSRFANAKDNKEAQDITDTVQSLLEAGGASFQDFAELPFNRTLGILTNSYDSRMDKVNKLAGSAITGFVPSVVKQVAQGIDPTSKQYSKKSGEAVVQQIKATIPGLRNTVPNRFDVTGETQTMTDNSTTAGNIFEMLLNPAYRDTIEVDKDLQKVLELNKKVGLPSLPKITNGYFSYKSNRYEMTQDEHQEFQSVYWNAYKRTYNKKNDGNFVNAHDYAMNQAKINYLKKKKVKFETTSSGNLK